MISHKNIVGLKCSKRNKWNIKIPAKLIISSKTSKMSNPSSISWTSSRISTSLLKNSMRTTITNKIRKKKYQKSSPNPYKWRWKNSLDLSSISNTNNNQTNDSHSYKYSKVSSTSAIVCTTKTIASSDKCKKSYKTILAMIRWKWLMFWGKTSNESKCIFCRKDSITRWKKLREYLLRYKTQKYSIKYVLISTWY